MSNLNSINGKSDSATVAYCNNLNDLNNNQNSQLEYNRFNLEACLNSTSSSKIICENISSNEPNLVKYFSKQKNDFKLDKFKQLNDYDSNKFNHEIDCYKKRDKLTPEQINKSLQRIIDIFGDERMLKIKEKFIDTSGLNQKINEINLIQNVTNIPKNNFKNNKILDCDKHNFNNFNNSNFLLKSFCNSKLNLEISTSNSFNKKKSNQNELKENKKLINQLCQNTKNLEVNLKEVDFNKIFIKDNQFNQRTIYQKEKSSIYKNLFFSTVLRNLDKKTIESILYNEDFVYNQNSNSEINLKIIKPKSIDQNKNDKKHSLNLFNKQDLSYSVEIEPSLLDEEQVEIIVATTNKDTLNNSSNSEYIIDNFKCASAEKITKSYKIFHKESRKQTPANRIEKNLSNTEKKKDNVTLILNENLNEFYLKELTENYNQKINQLNKNDLISNINKANSNNLNIETMNITKKKNHSPQKQFHQQITIQSSTPNTHVPSQSLLNMNTAVTIKEGSLFLQPISTSILSNHTSSNKLEQQKDHNFQKSKFKNKKILKHSPFLHENVTTCKKDLIDSFKIMPTYEEQIQDQSLSEDLSSSQQENSLLNKTFSSSTLNGNDFTQQLNLDEDQQFNIQSQPKLSSLNNNYNDSNLSFVGFNSQTNQQVNCAFTSLPVLNCEEDSIDDGIHLNSVPETRNTRDYRSHEEFVYAMKEDLAEWFNQIYDLQLNVHNFISQMGTGVILCRHANNLIKKAKQFYGQTETKQSIVNDNTLLQQTTQFQKMQNQLEQQKFSNYSENNLSNNSSNTELNSLSLPVNILSFSRSNAFNLSTSNILRPSKSAQASPQIVHKTTLLKGNSMFFSSTSKNNIIEKNKNHLHLKNMSKIPQFNSTSSLPIRTSINKINKPNLNPLVSKQDQNKTKSMSNLRYSIKNNSSTSNKYQNKTSNNLLISKPNSIALSTSSSSLMNKNSNLTNSNQNQHLLKTSLDLTTNKMLSASSNSIYRQFTKTCLTDKNHQLENNKLLKNKKIITNIDKQANVSSSTSICSINQLNSTKKQQSKQSLLSSFNISSQISTIIPKNQWTDQHYKFQYLNNADLIVYKDNVKCQTWLARDNVSNFIFYCRNVLKIRDCLLFETDDLVMRKNERSFILCLLEVARIGCNFGIMAPLIIQMEQEIDRELALDECQATISSELTSIDVKDTDSAISSDCELEEQHQANNSLNQIVTNDLKSLHERVVDLLSYCNCPSQFPMIKVADGKYRIGETKVLIFVRILRNHVMVRVGGGWDTLQQYLLRHDPCRCKTGHKYANHAKINITTKNKIKSNLNTSNRKLSLDSINSLSSNQYSSSINKNTFSTRTTDNDDLSIMVTYNR